MFRQMRRFKQQITEDECIEILKNGQRGVLSVNGEDGYPYGMPINFLYDDGKIYFHGAKEGHKIDAIRANDKVSFCVMDEGYFIEGKLGLNIKSVIVFGRISFVDDSEKAMDKLRKLGIKYFDEKYADHEIEKTGRNAQMLELTIEHMTGKLVNES
ncbi:MAG: pyridoxamine 5'-phosphate oxidase family protein [Eubacterium sp.]|jgi:nitroimidazol reductase NimA-like FMN-containing flavoprotein (pyridoxamine 5'-phosphate oxidase superfamily)